MNIPDIKAYIHALKLTWINRLFNEHPGKWKILLKKRLPIIVNLKEKGADLLKTKNVNPFWNDVIKAYCNINTKFIPKTAEELLAEPLFLNNHFKIAKKSFIFPEWMASNVTSVGALVKRDGHFKSLNEFIREYNFNPKPLDYFGCIGSIKAFAKKNSIEIKSDRANSEHKVITLLTGARTGAKPIYNAILGEKEQSKVCKKWEEITGKDIEWNTIFTTVNNIKESKLKWFQLKICYRVLVTNSMLVRMNIVNSNKCNFCLTERDTILHYLWDCPHVQIFWKDFVDLLKQKCANCQRLTLSSTFVLFGKDHYIKTDNCFDEILMKAKYYIFKCRINKVKPNLRFFVNNDLKQMYKVDKYVHYLEMKIDKFYGKWLLYANIIENQNER